MNTVGFSLDSPSNQLIYTTVRIEAFKNSGEASVGTGFFVNLDFEKGQVPIIVTNRHVVEGYDKGRFWVHKSTTGLADSAALPDEDSCKV